MHTLSRNIELGYLVLRRRAPGPVCVHGTHCQGHREDLFDTFHSVLIRKLPLDDPVMRLSIVFFYPRP
jgi:hypothetical protein